MPSHVVSRRGLLKRLLLPLLSAGVLTLSAPIAMASQTFLTLFDLEYTSLSDANAGCALCHDQSNPSRSDPIVNNGYGVALRDAGIATIGAAAFPLVESANSDGDSGGYSNLQEIQANAQPGWTTGDPVPSTVSGDLDPTTATDDPPVANAGPNVSGLVGDTITFDGSGSSDDNGIDSYEWTFGDGSSATGQTVSHIYTGADTYTVTLTVTDTAGQTDTDTAIAMIDPVPVDELPVANAGPDVSGLVGDTITFDGSGSSDDNGIDSYEWTFGDGSSATGQTVSHIYTGADTYTVTLTVTDTAGQTDTDTAIATIDPVPVDELPVANAGPDVSGLVGDTITFDGSGSSDDNGIASYEWTFGDGSSATGQTVSHTYTGADTYTVTLTVTDTAGQTDTDTAIATIDPVPVDELPVANAGPDVSGLVGDTITFDGSGSSDDNGIASYEWTFGDGSSATGQTVSHTYTGADTYTVTLTVTDTAGQTDTDTAIATIADINNPPVSDPNGPYSGTVGVTINFDGSGSDDADGTIISYAWGFGDGETGTGVTPSHIYTTAGTFDVTLTVTDNDGATDTATTTATIDALLVPPVADANGPYSGTVNDPVQFDGSGSSDADGSIVSYEWDFGDGASGTGVSPTHAYTATGEYAVSLTVTDNDGLQSTDSTTATIGEGAMPPVADANGPYSGTVSVPVEFDGSGSSDPNDDIVAYDWDFGDGTFVADAGPTPSHTYAAESIYTVTLTVIDATDLTDSATTTATITVDLQPPVADPNGPYTGTAGETVTFDGTGSSDPDGTVEEWNWDFGDGNTDTGAEPTHVYAAAGSYTVTLTVVDNDGLSSDPATTTADIVDQPEIPVADPNGPYSGKEGREVLFDGTASTDPDGGSINDYDWDFGDGNTGIGPTPTNVYAAEGSYTVTLVVTDDEGQVSDPAETSAEIVPDEAPTADPNGPYSGIIDVDVAFDGSASFDPDGTIVAWDWDFGDNSTGSGETTIHAYRSAGVYTVTLTVTDDFGNTGAATTTATITEPALLPPVSDAGGPYTGTEGEAVSFDGSGSTDPDGSIVRYDWDFGDGTLAEDAGPNPSHTYSTAGTYNVSLTVIDDDGLTDSDGTTAVIQTVSTGDADVFLSNMRVPNLLLLREDREVKKRIIVFGDGDTIEQDATVTLVASHPGLEVEIEPASVTETVIPGGTDTRFTFNVEIECEEPGSYVLDWTAVIDAAENADPANDSLTRSSEVECKGRTSRRYRGADRDDD